VVALDPPPLVPEAVPQERQATPPTQRRLAPRPTDDEVAAAPAPPTAATRAQGRRGLLRGELVPLLLLGGAVAATYVACLQVAEHRRQRRSSRR